MNIKAALNYKFAAANKKQSEADTALSQQAKAEDPTDPSESQDSPLGGISKATVHKAIGPLSISNIGLQYKDKKLSIILDAMLTLGPISVSLLGFGVDVTLGADLFTDLKFSDINWELCGLTAALDKPPMVIAGLFKNLSMPNMELFAGGVAVSIKVYTFFPFSSYGVIHNKFKTFFLFAQLCGPLIGLGFATINGVTIGFR